MNTPTFHALSKASIVRPPNDDGTLFKGDTVYSRHSNLSNFSDSGHICVVGKLQMEFSSHAGTHADNPHHFDETDDDLVEFPLAQYQGTGVLLDVSQSTADAEAISAEAIERELQKLAVVRRDDMRKLLFRTNPNTDYPTEPQSEFSYFSREAAELLAERGVNLVGIDTPSVDAPDQKDLSGNVHGIFLRARIAIVENLKLAPKKSMRGEIVTVFDPARDFPDARGIRDMYIFDPDDYKESPRGGW